MAEGDRWLTIPNALTVLRLLAILPFSVWAMQGRDTEALILFFLAGLTDTLDGTIARRFGQASKIGRLLDPLADKLFTGAAFVVLSLYRTGLSHIPGWVMLAVVLRDVYILLGSLFVYTAKRNSGFKPSVFGKLNTLVEIFVVLCFLAVALIPTAGTLLPNLYILLLISLLASAYDYFQVGLRMMRKPALAGGNK
jgi:cardiolipin synthase (CMP-forming)